MTIDPYQILTISPKNATDETVRKAYMEAIRRHPPDRDPEAFERIRNAYELIDNEQKRIQLDLFGLDNKHKLAERLPESEDRPHAGPAKWIAAIEEESRRIAQTNPYESAKNE
jgi:curved DNA-binding protein CbpA